MFFDSHIEDERPSSLPSTIVPDRRTEEEVRKEPPIDDPSEAHFRDLLRDDDEETGSEFHPEFYDADDDNDLF